MRKKLRKARKLAVIMAATILSALSLENLQPFAQAEEEQTQETVETATYTATTTGYGGDVTVWVTVQDGVITDVTAQGLDETQGKGSVAIEELPAMIVEANGTDVDDISGASVTSQALKKAVEDALENKTSGEQPDTIDQVTYTPGTYTGQGFGFASYWTVEVTFSENTIESIEIPTQQKKR